VPVILTEAAFAFIGKAAIEADKHTAPTRRER